MRLLVVTTLTATLVGCSCFAPQQQVQQALVTGCTEADGFACSDGNVSAPNPPLVLHDHPVAETKTTTAKKENLQSRKKADIRIKNAKSKFEPKTDMRSSVQAEDKSKHTQSPIAEAKTDASQSSSLDDNDSVIRKAKAAIAAKVRKPNVELVEMVRGTEKDALGKSSIDIICGHIRQENVDIPFVYIVQKDEAYIGDMMGTTEAYKYLATCLAIGRSTQ